MGRKHRWWCVLHCFFIRIRPLLLIPVCLGMGGTGTGCCHLRYLGGSNGVANEAPVRYQRFGSHPTRPRWNARPFRQCFTGNPRSSGLPLRFNVDEIKKAGGIHIHPAPLTHKTLYFNCFSKVISTSLFTSEFSFNLIPFVSEVIFNSFRLNDTNPGARTPLRSS